MCAERGGRDEDGGWRKRRMRRRRRPPPPPPCCRRHRHHNRCRERRQRRSRHRNFRRSHHHHQHHRRHHHRRRHHHHRCRRRHRHRHRHRRHHRRRSHHRRRHHRLHLRPPAQPLKHPPAQGPYRLAPPPPRERTRDLDVCLLWQTQSTRTRRGCWVLARSGCGRRTRAVLVGVSRSKFGGCGCFLGGASGAARSCHPQWRRARARPPRRSPFATRRSARSLRGRRSTRPSTRACERRTATCTASTSFACSRA